MRDRLSWAIAAAVVALLWMARYEVTAAPGLVVRHDRWTGTTYVLREWRWVAIRIAEAQ